MAHLARLRLDCDDYPTIGLGNRVWNAIVGSNDRVWLQERLNQDRSGRTVVTVAPRANDRAAPLRCSASASLTGLHPPPQLHYALRITSVCPIDIRTALQVSKGGPEAGSNC